MSDFGDKMFGVTIVVYFCFLALFIVDMQEIKDLKNINKQLKQEKYDLKQKLEKAEQERLNCLVGLGE